MSSKYWLVIFLCCNVLRAESQLRPFLTLLNQTGPVISDEDRAKHAGFGFEGGRVVKDRSGTYWLFTAEFQGWPVNANMRIAIWSAERAIGPWTRQSTIAASEGDGTSIETWNRTCRRENLAASPWAPFPIFSDTEDRWHVLWVSYSCDLSWVVRVGVSNIFGAVSTVAGPDGIAGPYEQYGIVLGPNATGETSTRWGDLSACVLCHTNASPEASTRPPYCDAPPCLYDNGITGAAIGMSPFELPPGAAVKYGAFVGLDHNFAGSNSPRGPWTVYSSQQMGQYMNVKMSTSSSLYSENPVVTRITHPDGRSVFVSVFDTVSPTGGWAWENSAWQPAGRGESYGFGISYSEDGRFWNPGQDVAVQGGVRTPLGLLEELDGTYTMLFTRRFGDCRSQILPRGSRGDGANDRTMCANLYAASFALKWVSAELASASPTSIV